MTAYTDPLTEPTSRGLGYSTLEYGVQPAAGAHFVYTVPGEYQVRPLSIFCRLVTDATAASREVAIEFRDDADRRFRHAGAPVTQPASDTVDYIFDVHTPRAEWETESSVIVPLPLVILDPTFDFRVFVVNVQAGDQLSAIRFQAERFPTGPPAR